MAHTLPSLCSYIAGWLDACMDNDNPMVTLRYLDTPDGQVQLKWWKRCRILMVYNVNLSSFPDGLTDYKGALAFTSLCGYLLSMTEYDIAEIRLVGVVDDPDLLDIEHTIHLKRGYLQSIVDPAPIPFIVGSSWYARTLRENQEKRDEVLKEITQLEEEKGRRCSLDNMLSRFGWERHSDSEFRLRKWQSSTTLCML